jgi:hypothetical protein
VNLKHRRQLAITTPRSLTFVILFPLLPRRVIQTRPIQSLPTLPFFSFFQSFLFFELAVLLFSFCLLVFPLFRPPRPDSKGPADPEHFVVVSCISSRVSGQSYREVTDSSEGPRVFVVFNRVGFPPSSLPHLSTVCRSTPIASILACGNLEKSNNSCRWSARQRFRKESSCDSSL